MLLIQYACVFSYGNVNLSKGDQDCLKTYNCRAHKNERACSRHQECKFVEVLTIDMWNGNVQVSGSSKYAKYVKKQMLMIITHALFFSEQRRFCMAVYSQQLDERGVKVQLVTFGRN